MEKGAQLGLGEGPIKSWYYVPTPLYQWYLVTHSASYSRTYVRFLSQLYSRQLRVSCFLMFRGACTYVQYQHLAQVWCKLVWMLCYNLILFQLHKTDLIVFNFLMFMPPDTRNIHNKSQCIQTSTLLNDELRLMSLSISHEYYICWWHWIM